VSAPLRLLLLEDNPTDADLIVSLLSESGLACRARRVGSREAFVEALNEGAVDIILADYSLPGFSGEAALDLSRQLAPDVPFLFVSATIGEELAIDLMHRGATDYILKQRLGRLVPSVQRALREASDRTERRRAQEALRQSELQLRQAQKMEAIGRLAGGLAHDFNNLLTVIMGQSQVMLAELKADDHLRPKIEEIRGAGERAAVLIRQLLAFSRRQPVAAEVLDVNGIVANIETMLRRLIGEHITLIVRLSKEPLLVKGDPSQIEQVVMNLVVNARDAMPQGGTLIIETAEAELQRTPMYAFTPPPPGSYARLSVTDTGCGMSQHVQSRMFEPFFTTKEEGKGTGLGLSTVFGIVAQGGGGIDVTSAVGKGTRFDVYLPLMVGEVRPEAAFSDSFRPARGRETILLAEDDSGVRELIHDLLIKLGYRVYVAGNGVEACAVGMQHLGDIDLLLMDVVMPGMSGTDVARHLRALKPGLKQLFISGYPDHAALGREDPDSAYVQKPFAPEMLAEAIRDLLDGPIEQRGTQRGGSHSA
jgi:two-component system cell cycle sensor histidine kinase/response regulator CckA